MPREDAARKVMAFEVLEALGARAVVEFVLLKVVFCAVGCGGWNEEEGLGGLA